MKHFILGLLALLTFALPAQTLEDITPKQRREYNQALRQAERNANEQERRGYDIVLDPIEVTPQPIEGSRAADFNNWGNQLLRANLADRMRNECVYPVTVKVADTASDYDHSDLKNAEIPGANYTTDPGIVPDGNGHSTHCGGIIGGSQGGLIFPLVEAGLVRIKPVQVLSASGSGSFAWVANMLQGERPDDIAIKAGGGRVVYNFSLGGGTALVGAVETQAQLSTGTGAILVAAAGNNAGPVSYPGLSQYFLAVSAIDKANKIASFSNRGQAVTAAMPGVSINSTYKNGQWAALSGTSMAAPFYTAVSALAISKWGPKIGDWRHLQKYLAAIATDLGAAGKDDLYGNGINFCLAVLDTDPTNIGGGPTPPPPPPPADQFSTVSATFFGPYVMRYKLEGAGDWSILIVSNIDATLTAKGTAIDVYATLDKTVTAYFPNRGIVLPVDMQYTDGVYWTGQFLEYVAKNAVLNLQVISVTGRTESGQSHTATVFDKAGEGERGIEPILETLK